VISFFFFQNRWLAPTNAADGRPHDTRTPLQNDCRVLSITTHAQHCPPHPMSTFPLTRPATNHAAGGCTRVTGVGTPSKVFETDVLPKTLSGQPPESCPNRPPFATFFCAPRILSFSHHPSRSPPPPILLVVYDHGARGSADAEPQRPITPPRDSKKTAITCRFFRDHGIDRDRLTKNPGVRRNLLRSQSVKRRSSGPALQDFWHGPKGDGLSFWPGPATASWR